MVHHPMPSSSLYFILIHEISQPVCRLFPALGRKCRRMLFAAMDAALPSSLAAGEVAAIDILFVQCRLAGEYDAVQKRGEVQRHGGQAKGIFPMRISVLSSPTPASHPSRSTRPAPPLE
jgi:hypothetical protein